MKKSLSLFLIFFSLYSCKKDNLTVADKVTYEVTLTNSTSWHGGYLNENAQVVGIENAPNNWEYTFENTNNLSVLTLSAYADGNQIGADAYLKISINGTIVASGYSSSSPQIQYLY